MTTKLDLQKLESLAVPEGQWLQLAARWLGETGELPKAREGRMVVMEDRSWED